MGGRSDASWEYRAALVRRLFSTWMMAGVPSPNRELFVSVFTIEISGQAASGKRRRLHGFVAVAQIPTIRLHVGRRRLHRPPGSDAADHRRCPLCAGRDADAALQAGPSTPSVVAFRQPDGRACRTSNRCDVTVTITDNDPSTDATLSGLAVNDGSTDLLTTFAPGTTDYAATVANSVDEVTPTTTDTNATPEFLNASDTALDDADDVANGHQVALAEGDTVFKVQVTAEDTTTTQTYTVTVTRGAAGTTTVAIAADQPAFTGRLDWVTFTLTRTGDPAAALDVAVALTQDQDLLDSGDLAQTVTFGAGNATATLTLFPFVSVQTVTQETTLTATVEAGTGYAPGSPTTASTRIVAANPAVTVSLDQTAYTFAEDATVATVAIILRTATACRRPIRTSSSPSAPRKSPDRR